MGYRNPRHGVLERMLRIHEELRRGSPTNCTKLCEALELSRRTVVRAIEYMRDRHNLPIEFDAVRNTYRYTEPVGAFPTQKVTEGEVFALLVARKALEQYRGTPFHRQLAASFDKLAAGLKETVSFAPTDELQAVSFKNVGLGKSDLEVFNALSRGITRQLEVEFDYRKPGATQTAHRRVQPYHLSNRENLWYLVGFDVERNALRTFAVPRITRAAVTDAKFKRPADFSPEKFFATALGVLGGEANHQVVIRFTPAVADRVREREWHESQKLRDLRDGSLELTLRLGALPEIERWVLTWGGEAEVLQPKELRTRLQETTAKLARMYQ
jgi:predicted DNA-binding transcriptional regulator YafY